MDLASPANPGAGVGVFSRFESDRLLRALGTLAAIVLITVVGAVAIYYIHESAPALSSDLLARKPRVPAADTNSSTPAPASNRAASALSTPTSASTPSSSTPTSVASTPTGVASVPGAAPAGTLASGSATGPFANQTAVIGGPTASATSTPSGLYQTAPGAVTAVGNTLAPPSQAAPSPNSIGWSPADRVKPGSAGTPSRPATPHGASGATLTAANPRAPASGMSEASPSNPGSGQSSPSYSGRDATTTVAGLGSSAAPPADPWAGESLASAQQAGCASSGAIGRFFCNEKVRWNYCRGRWNKHPDCVGAEPNRAP